MSKSLIQSGSLRRRNQPKPSTLADNRTVVVEYRHSNRPWVTGVFDIIRVSTVDGKPIDPDEYWFHADEQGLLFPQHDAALTQDNDGKWQRR
jgi:hypothetical protein